MSKETPHASINVPIALPRRYSGISLTTMIVDALEEALAISQEAESVLNSLDVPLSLPDSDPECNKERTNHSLAKQ
jgi:hypothetical protein